MATVVDLSKGYIYISGYLLVWCMSSAPRVFIVKRALMLSFFVWCMSSVSRVFDGKRAPVTSYSFSAPRVVDG